MNNVLQSFSSFVRNLAALILAGVLAVGSWLGYNVFNQRAILEDELKQSHADLEQSKVEAGRLREDVAAKARQIERLDMALRLMKVNHRAAEIVVLDQWESEVEKRLKTKFEFREIDDGGHPLDAQPRVFTIDGDIVYVDAYVIKYNDELVEQGNDPLRSTNVFVFRRLFGELQKPADGFPLDQTTSRPVIYGKPDEMTDYQKELWSHFWEYANDAEKAKEARIRVAQGEAPSIKLQRGKLYTISLRASGGLEITSQDLPPDRAKAF